MLAAGLTPPREDAKVLPEKGRPKRTRKIAFHR